MNDDERAARVAELQRMLADQRERDDELRRELQGLIASGGERMNDAIRAGAGRGRATGCGSDMNDAIRRAAGRAPANNEEGS